MALKIMPHGRLQEWVAEEKGYFTAAGLEYRFVISGDYGVSSVARDEAREVKTGAFETFGAGRSGADVSCACHWATNAAARERAGHLITTAYSVAPCAIVVPPESPIRRPEDLAGVPIGVGYHSGSHFATVQALEPVLAAGELNLTFQGPPNERLDALLDRQVPAATTWGVPLYVAEAFGFRKIRDATFMIGFLVTGADATKSTWTSTWPPSARHSRRSTSVPSSTSTITCGPSRRSTARGWTCGRSAPASASCSSPTPGKSSRRPNNGPNPTSSSHLPPPRRITTRPSCPNSAADPTPPVQQFQINYPERSRGDSSADATPDRRRTSHRSRSPILGHSGHKSGRLLCEVRCAVKHRVPI